MSFKSVRYWRWGGGGGGGEEGHYRIFVNWAIFCMDQCMDNVLFFVV